MPYALASGILPPHSAQARDVLRYMLGHGSRILGLVRASAFTLYRDPEFPRSGTDQVYGLSMARFLADNDRADQLVVSLYGQLAAGMTRGTYISGEAATVAPVRGELYRKMFLPPNSGSNAAFLETLRLMLVHEVEDSDGAPHELELAFATPRSWLRPGRTIAVENAPTSFGTLSYDVRNGGLGPRVAGPSSGQRSCGRRSCGCACRAVGTSHGCFVAGRPYGRFDRQTGDDRPHRLAHQCRARRALRLASRPRQRGGRRLRLRARRRRAPLSASSTARDSMRSWKNSQTARMTASSGRATKMPGSS
jgi:hypothetical protein